LHGYSFQKSLTYFLPDFTQNQAGVAIAFFSLQLWMGQVLRRS